MVKHVYICKPYNVDAALSIILAHIVGSNLKKSVKVLIKSVNNTSF